MHYYYDILVNMSEYYWEFYEWEKDDFICGIKKIPILRISHLDIQNLLKYNIIFSKDFIAKYLGKTILKNEYKKRNCLLLSDTQNSVFLEFDADGNILSRSKLLIEDENNCNEIAHSFTKENIEYQQLDRIMERDSFRQEEIEKQWLKKELEQMKQTNNYQKCAYLYYECFEKNEDNLEKMLEDFNSLLESDYDMKIHKIISLLKLSCKENL